MPCFGGGHQGNAVFQCGRCAQVSAMTTGSQVPDGCASAACWPSVLAVGVVCPRWLWPARTGLSAFHGVHANEA